MLPDPSLQVLEQSLLLLPTEKTKCEEVTGACAQRPKPAFLEPK